MAKKLSRCKDIIIIAMMLLMLMILLMMQVEWREVDKWTMVELISEKGPIPASYAMVYIYPGQEYYAGISDVTADACIPSAGKYFISQFSHPISLFFSIDVLLLCVVIDQYSVGIIAV